MAPVMILLMSRDMRAMWPGEPLFWFVMSLGVVVGFTIAYPINVWLVAQGMKHGLMTVRAQHQKGSEQDEHHEHHEHHEHGGPAHEAEAAPTRVQLATLTGFATLLLIAGMFVPAAFVNMRVSAEEVRGTVMPPG